MNTTNTQLPFTFTSKVVHGEKVGRTIGFPTANFADTPSESELHPGVYFGLCHLADQTETQAETPASVANDIPASRHPCLVYFGPRYLFGEQKNNFEVYLYDFEGNLYDQYLTVTLLEFMRNPINLPDLHALQAQLDKDKVVGQMILESHATVRD